MKTNKKSSPPPVTHIPDIVGGLLAICLICLEGLHNVTFNVRLTINPSTHTSYLGISASSGCVFKPTLVSCQSQTLKSEEIIFCFLYKKKGTTLCLKY